MSDPTAASAPEAPGTAPPTGGGGRALRSTLLVSAATLGSRVMGLVREQLFAGLVGAGFYGDAFVVAFRIPNLLRDLFAEGALSAAFVPTFTAVDKRQGADAAHRAANQIVGALLVVVGAVTIALVLAAEPIVLLLAPGFAAEPGKVELTARLARLMMPFLPVVSLAAVAMGMLNSRGRFGTPALAPALFNAVAIVFGAALWLGGAGPEAAVVGWSVGTLLGGVAQLGVQLVPLWRQGWRPRIAWLGWWGDPSVRRVGRLMVPALIGLAATELNLFFNTAMASDEPGANAWLNYAFRLMYVPIGVFGVAIATVTATALARKAADRDVAGMKDRMATGLRHVAFLTVPATVGMVVLAEPIVAVIYERGRFTAADTAATALALGAYALGLYAYSGVKVVSPAFYALDRARVPLIASASAVATNLVLNLLFHRWLGFAGLALGTSLGAIVNLAVLTIAFQRESAAVPWPPGQVAQLVRVALAAAAMGAVVLAVVSGVEIALGDDTFVARLAAVTAGIGVGAAAYAGVCALLRVGEMDDVLAVLRRRLGR